MERRIRAQRASAEAIETVRRRRERLRSRLSNLTMGIVPPARETLGSSTNGEVVTATLIAWARTMAGWSLIACVFLAVALVVRILLGQ